MLVFDYAMVATDGETSRRICVDCTRFTREATPQRQEKDHDGIGLQRPAYLGCEPVRLIRCNKLKQASQIELRREEELETSSKPHPVMGKATATYCLRGALPPVDLRAVCVENAGALLWVSIRLR